MSDETDRAVEVPEPPAGAARLFGDRLNLAQRYAMWLAGAGVARGLIGPREVPRLWSRHLLNCAVLAELIPTGRLVADVGTGAGLPGLVLAIARDDLRVVLIEPMLRRTRFLDEVVADLGLEARVTVRRARAEELRGVDADIVTSRAVAPAARLAAWSLPLLRPGGLMLALKGAGAGAELAEAAPTLRRLGGEHAEIVTVGSWLEEPATVLRVVRADRDGRGSGRAGQTGRAGRSGPARRSR
ncbi:MAG TPA: 16S rRNA (guanine(527)-N(7))-methyltransferase RsmG [Actinomycetes bacterium]|nr:16S rRNA (guanine(527)-N(7))-methyltransferase RsmG [Actinomycetes bacterium]